MVSEALADAAAALGGGLAGRRAVVVGAGAMGGLAAAHLRRAGVAEIVVLEPVAGAGRAAGRDHRARTARPARAAGLAALAAELATADLVVACTGAVGTVVELGTRRRGRRRARRAAARRVRPRAAPRRRPARRPSCPASP